MIGDGHGNVWLFGFYIAAFKTQNVTLYNIVCIYYNY